MVGGRLYLMNHGLQELKKNVEDIISYKKYYGRIENDSKLCGTNT
jgi:hypothetical protein